VRAAAEIRSDSLLDPHVAFLNRGSFGTAPHDHPAELRRALVDECRIGVPVHHVDGQTLVRLSVQAYTTDEDCGRLVEALTTLI
jgi:selenocysteine lyase/cysteine desulfurase